MNAADIQKSERLQKVDALLSSGLEFSTMAIIAQANVCAVNSIVAELRENGRVIHCRRDGGKWLYRMEV
ncbi:hypothetical protein [Desulfatibacillum aliphaticivorans]|uniref:hypothetical protein n=1 Tax=Desulfatibacillum aliphaticivorans TaxID=218208 RepID=UPI0004047C1C|nr:hypothetical protein [Desulfatibacillum aliphaticivorans]